MAAKSTQVEFIHMLTIRFTNGETTQHMVSELLDPADITPETRFAVMLSYLKEDPDKCVEVAFVNIEDVTYLKTERIALERYIAESRPPGIRSVDSTLDSRLLRTITRVKLI